MFKKNTQSGQTLVETVVGLVILTVGISTSLGLATTIFTQSTQATKKVIAVGLAREGVEAWFNMRGTNWLQDVLYDACYDYPADSAVAFCKPGWDNLLYEMEGDSTGVLYSLNFDPGDLDLFWLTLSGENQDFRLYRDDTMTSGKLYSTDSADGSPSEFYRQVQIFTDDNTVFPYDQDTEGAYYRIRVVSRVWWVGPGCPETNTWPGSKKCGVELSTYMTNWRNY